MSKRLISITFLVIGLVSTSSAQKLTNDNLLKLYSYLVDAVAGPKSQIKTFTVNSFNHYLSGKSKNWQTAKADEFISDSGESWNHVNYVVNDELRAFLSVRFEASDNGIKPSLAYFTPFYAEYHTSLSQISRVGKFIKQTKNDLNGIDKLYSVYGMKFRYSTFPVRKDSFKLGGKPVQLYKITIFND
ncbi:hypothetical protein [Desertivirga xinjiangensis]|uniref:hypothetical protein n=1 Tax=Desertivirga xinjiangensis TaxID=539206 RepID=UPI00210C2B40|nr:hypothetical protein [Pedobacter xinjiangensis]